MEETQCSLCCRSLCGSLFMCVSLFSNIEVSFHVIVLCSDLLRRSHKLVDTIHCIVGLCVGLFSHIYVSFFIYKSVSIRLFSHDRSLFRSL